MTGEKNDSLMKAARLAGALPGLLLEAEKIAQTFMRGTHGRRRAGQGEAFWQFRQYQQGDSGRDIDWKQTAKREDAFVREREWEAAQTLWLYRDGTESMNFRSARDHATKKDYAEVLLLALGMVALAGGEQVGILGGGMRPQSHESAIHKIHLALHQQQGPVRQGLPVTARSRVVVFGDFYQPPETLAAFCADLAARQVSGLLVQICDRAEETLPYGGRVRFQDAEERGASPLIIPQVEAIRAEYQNRFEAHRRSVAECAANWGWRFMHATTTDRPETVLAEIYNLLTPARRGA